MKQECRYVPMDYGQAVDWSHFEGREPGAVEAWVLDFSLPAGDFRRLRGLVGELVWIDHHQTAIDALGKEFGGLPGRRGTQQAACLMTWTYCNPDIPAPLPVKLIADRDVWELKYGVMSKYFHEAFWQQDPRPSSTVWDRWLAPGPAQIYDELADGEIIYKAKEKSIRQILMRYGRVVPLHGTDNMTVLTLNFPGTGELGEAAREMGHNVLHCYHDELRGGRLVRVNRLYSQAVDVGELARLRGGGGHRNAAGWVKILK
jgi:hypothetical protein